MRMEDTPYDIAMTRSKQELARQVVEYDARIEAVRDAVEKKLRGLSTQWALHGGPFDHAWVSEVMATFAPERRCAKCGCLTNGEEALVNGKIWCHSCADRVAEQK